MPKSVSFEFDPFELAGIERPKTKADTKKALEEIADYVKTEILRHVGDGVSPVQGGKFKRGLSPAYKKLKESMSSAGFANLELTGAMLDALEANITDDGKIEVGIFDSDQVEKARNHNEGDTLPQRQFIPNEGEKFKQPIMRGIKDIAESYLDGSD